MSRSLQFHAKAKRIYPEAALQRGVVQFLTLAGTPRMVFFSIKNEGRRSEALGSEFKRQGMKPGASDLCVIAPGKMPLFLELKAKGGKQLPEQVAFQADVVMAECRYEIADSLDAATRILADYGAIRMAARAA